MSKLVATAYPTTPICEESQGVDLPASIASDDDSDVEYIGTTTKQNLELNLTLAKLGVLIDINRDCMTLEFPGEPQKIEGRLLEITRASASGVDYASLLRTCPNLRELTLCNVPVDIQAVLDAYDGHTLRFVNCTTAVKTANRPATVNIEKSEASAPRTRSSVKNEPPVKVPIPSKPEIARASAEPSEPGGASVQFATLRVLEFADTPVCLSVEAKAKLGFLRFSGTTSQIGVVLTLRSQVGTLVVNNTRFECSELMEAPLVTNLVIGNSRVQRSIKVSETAIVFNSISDVEINVHSIRGMSLDSRVSAFRSVNGTRFGSKYDDYKSDLIWDRGMVCHGSGSLSEKLETGIRFLQLTPEIIGLIKSVSDL